MRNLFRRPIGQILLDGKLLSTQTLERALGEQKHTRELLGQVLVRMGLLKPGDIGAPLLLQKHLNHINDAVKVAGGEIDDFRREAITVFKTIRYQKIDAGAEQA